MPHFQFNKSLKERAYHLYSSSLFSVFTLARWRLRHTWLLLFVMLFGMVAAVIIVCAVPLLWNVMVTVGLRSTLGATPDSAEMSMSANTTGLSTAATQNIHHQFDTLFKQYLGTSAVPTQSFIQSTDFSFVPARGGTSLFLYGTAMQQAAHHLSNLQGRLPSITSDVGTSIEILLTPETAQQLGVHPGSTLPLRLNVLLEPSNSYSAISPRQENILLSAHIAGLFTIAPKDSAYWHSEDFNPRTYTSVPGGKVTQYTMLLPGDALLAIFDHLSAAAHTSAVFSTTYGFALRWYYQLDASHLSSSTLDALINQIAALQSDITITYGDNLTGLDFPYLNNVQLAGTPLNTSDAASNLVLFRNRVAVARLPVGVLTLQMAALILFFVSLMTDLLVERHADAISLLRSRGASSWQVLGALLTQGIGLGILALALSPFLAILVVLFSSRRILPLTEQNALNSITGNPVSAVISVLLYALAVVLAAILAMGLSLFFATRADVLSLRREATRSTRRPLWQRLNLDVIAGVIALVGYGISMYLTHVGSILQGDARTLIITPLALIAPFFLLIGCLLLFLRIFPVLLRLAARLTMRGRGAASMLALTQIARSPRQPIRMTLLLALATAFVLFTLVYTATEAQHIQEVGTYQPGADFSGDIGTTDHPLSQAQLTSLFQAIPGVLSANVGYVGQGTSTEAALPLDIRAVDAQSFVKTVTWPTQEAAHSATSLLDTLLQQRQQAIQGDFVPTIVNKVTEDTLHLHDGSRIQVMINSETGQTMNCLVVGTLPHIPTVNDDTAPGYGNGFAALGALLLDYQTFANVYAQDVKKVEVIRNMELPTSQPVNHVWLHTLNDPASLASVRTALTSSSLHLSNLSDRRAILTALYSDPLYLIISSVLRIGTITALLLAVVGDLLVSWTSIRTRLVNFALLRALGTTPRQMVNVVTWEQAILYVTGLLLGIAFGTLLVITVIPLLIFTNSTADLSSSDFYALQSALPTQLVIPSSLPVGLLVFVSIFIVVLVATVRVISQPSMSQMLRLNED